MRPAHCLPALLLRFEATGLSIEDVTFKNEALAQAMNDSEVSAEQFALMFQESSVITLSSRAIFIESVSWVPKSSIWLFNPP